MDEILASRQPLREPAVEHVLATHGGVFDRTALERAPGPHLQGG